MKGAIGITYILFGLLYYSYAKQCPESSRPHKTRCDAYFKCIVLPSKSHVWVPEKCGEGLIYEPNLKMCVLPGDDWECVLGDAVAVNLDDHNIFGIKNIDTNITAAKFVTTEDPQIYSDSELEITDDIESSGEGHIPEDMEAVELEVRESDDETEIPSHSEVDPSLTANLQRLSQLIDGLKNTYQNTDSPVADLRPDQLNAFLAHYKIQTEFNALNPNGIKSNSSENMKLENSTDTMRDETLKSNLGPETKVVLSNYLPRKKPFHQGSGGYSNSQIVVNRPEGSVLFTLPQSHENSYGYDHTNYHDEPKISEETLKTVLELSKQMLANQNIRQVFPANNYYQPLVQPIYLQPQNYPTFAFQHSFNGDKNYNKYSQSQPLSSNADRKPTTIIHNNVIPVHLTNSATIPNNNDKVDSYGNKIDTYNKPDYAPYSSEEANESQSTYSNVGSYQAESDESIQSDQYEHHRYPPLLQNSHPNTQSNRYENNKFVQISAQSGSYSEDDKYAFNKYHEFSTPRPPILARPPISNFYTPNPHLDESNVNNIFQTDRYPTLQYGELPRPINANRPSHGSSISSQKPTTFLTPIGQLHSANKYLQRPLSSYYQQTLPTPIFPHNINPSHIDISPNSYKSESMETPDEDDVSPGVDESGTANNNIVTSELALNVDESGTKRTHYKAIMNSNGNNAAVEGSQLVNLGGNFISYDIFKNQLIPALSSNNEQSIDESNVEIITCTAGVRQPNITDCTKYYVCSKKDGKVLSYACPPYTGFNEQSRICDAKTYSLCNPDAVLNRYTISENRKIQLEAMKALQNAKRIRDQAIQTQNLQNLIKLEATNPPRIQNKPNDVNFSIMTAMSQGIKPIPVAVGQKRPGPSKKRKYYCREGDKIPDQTSIYNYFVCYKSNGMMKGHRMTCSKGLLFCPKTSMCTLPQKCV